MVVCKFFQQGSCRYGQNCRFDHIYSSKYSYHAQSEPEPVATTAVTDDQLVNQVHTDVQSMLQGGQWLLSGYAPFKEKPTFPGLIDLSAEEARLFIYEAKANNTLDQAVAYMNNLFLEAKQKYQLLLSKNPTITKVLRSLYNGENVASPFGNLPQTNSSFGNSNAASVFRAAAQPNQPSVFSQNTTPQSVFGQANQNTFGQSADPAKSIFAQATQNVFQNQNANQAPSIFCSSTPNAPSQPSVFVQPSSAQSIFAQASQTAFVQNVSPQPAPNIFNNQNAQNTATSMFASASQPLVGPSPFNQPSNHGTNVFQKPSSSGFGIQNQHVVNPGVYSNIEDLSSVDMEAFSSDHFKLGFIPELPPPQSLCL